MLSSLPTPPELNTRPAVITTKVNLNLNLRQSCAFCRKRKIKCSGESTGCKACQARSQPCLFEATAPMGRPKKIRAGVATTPTAAAPVAPTPQLVEQRRASSTSVSASSSSATTSGAVVALSPASHQPLPQPAKRPSSLRVEDPSSRPTPTINTNYSSRKAPRVTLDHVLSLSKLRLTPFKTTFEAFEGESLGVMVRAFYELITLAPSPTSPSSLHQKLPPETRTLYSTIFHSRTPSRSPRESTVRALTVCEGRGMWGWLGSEMLGAVVSRGTGKGKGKGRSEEGSFLLRLLEEDQSTPFEVDPRGFDLHADPIRRLTCPEVHHLLLRFFRHSPFSYLLNDSLLLSSLHSHTYDPALLCVLLGIALTLPSDPSSSSSDPSPTSQEFLAHALSLLLSRSNAHTVNSLSAIQALLILSVHLGASQHRLRQAWSLLASGYAVAREMLGRSATHQGSRGRGGEEMNERERVEREGLRVVCWSYAIFASWAFLSLDLPRSTLLDVTDSLALPAFRPEQSVNYHYRNAVQHPRFDAASLSLHEAYSSFSETTRILSLVITLSLPTLQVPPALHGASPPPLGVGDERTQRMPAFVLGVADWLLGLGDGWMMMVDNTTGEAGEGECPLLAACCAVLALSRLSPASGEEEDGGEDEQRVGEGLLVGGWRLVLRAVEGLVNAEAREGSAAGATCAGGGRRRIGTTTGLQRVVQGALPRSLALLNRLLQLGNSASTNPALLSLVTVEQARISLLQANLVALLHRPSSLPSTFGGGGTPPLFHYAHPPGGRQQAFSEQLVGTDFLPPPPHPALLPRSDSSGSLESLYTLATGTTAVSSSSYHDSILPPNSFTLGGGYNSPFPSLSFALDSPPPPSAIPPPRLPPTEGYSPSAFILTLPPTSTSSTKSSTFGTPPVSMTSAMASLPSPPETVVEERWTAAAAEPTMLSPVEMIRRILGKGQRGSVKRRKELGRV